MGQQQLLLITLSVIIVGVAVSVGVNMFQSGAVEANRQALVSDVVNAAAKAQKYYRTPEAMAGGGQNFDGFKLSTPDTANPNGVFTISTSKPNSNAGISGSVTPISGSSGTIYVVASGKEKGDDGTNPVKVYAKVTADSIQSVILN